MTAVIIGIRFARAVTAVATVPALTVVTQQAFVTRPGGMAAWAAVGAVIAVITAGASPSSSPWPL